MASSANELVLRVTATQELLERQLREMGRNVDTFEQAAETRIDQLEKRFSGINLRGAIDAVKQADQAFRSSFSSIQSQAAQMAASVAQTGQVDLTPLIEQARNHAAMLNAEQVATAALLRAEEARLAKIEQVTMQEQAAVAAGRAALAQSQQKAQAATIEAQRLEALQAELGQTAVAQQKLTSTSGAARAGLQQAGFQVQDFAVQVAGGTSATRAFSLQAPQLFGALQLMASGAENSKGKFAAFANFLGGPWGVAIGIAIPLAGMLVEKLLDVGDAADTVKAKASAAQTAIQRLFALAGQVKYEGDYSAVQASILTGEAAVSRLDQQIAAAQSRYDTIVAAGSGANPEAALAAQASALRQVSNLESQRAAAQQNVDKQRAALEAVNEQIAIRQRADAARAKLWPDASGSSGGGSSGSSRTVREAQQVQSAADKAREALEKMAAANSVLLGNDAQFTGNTNLDDPNNPVTKMVQASLEGKERLAEFHAQMDKMAEQTKVKWTDAAQTVISSLQSMSNAIESGDILDILSAALGLFEQLGGLGVFGSTIQNNLLHPNISAPVKARASGGPVSAKTPYLVGENGPELFVPNAGGQIISNDNLRSPSVSRGTLAGIAAQRVQTVVVQVQANDYFDARVDSRASAVATPLSLRAAAAGSGLAQADIARRNRNRIPGR